MIVLSCKDIQKTYGIKKVLENITFTVEDGEKIGIVGLNGSGKSTLFNILSGETSKDIGDIYIQKGLRIGYLKQNININSNKTLFDECSSVFEDLIQTEKKLRMMEEEISNNSQNKESNYLHKLMEEYSFLLEEFSNHNGYGFKNEIRRVLDGLGFSHEDMDKEVNKLSGGQKARLSLAKLLLEKPDILLLDEPTNHLDIEAIDWLEKFLKEYKGAALIISHDRYFLDNVIDKIFLLENLKIDIYKGNYTEFMKKRIKDLELLKKNYEDQKKEIERQEEIIRRFMSYGGKRYIRQAQSRQKILEKIKKMPKPKTDAKKARITFVPKIISGREVLKVENLKKSFNGNVIFENINFNVYRGEKVGLIGPNGVGKTTLFKTILGEIPHDEGEIILGHHVNIGYFDQEQQKLNTEKSIIDEIWDEHPDLDHWQIRTLLGQFLFIGDDIFKEINELSGGERSRLAILKLMLSKSNFLMMDEPTNHLDIDSKEVLEEALINYEGTLFVISHDRYFLNKTVNKILQLSEKGIAEYLGNFDYYIQKKKEKNTDEDKYNIINKTQIKIQRKKERGKKEREREKKCQLLQIEEMISNEEEKINLIDQEMCKVEIYENPNKIVELTKAREAAKLKSEKLYEQLINLTEE